MPTPVTVGVPVYNNGTTLRRTVESLLAQTVPPAVIDISDNASTDSTEEVGRALAAHPNVRYHRHSIGLGPPGNFAFLLSWAETPYFMWLAADDYVLPTYLEKTSACLDAHPDVATCVSQVVFTGENGEWKEATGSRPLRADVRCNLARYINEPGANARVYGLHRTEVVRRAYPPGRFHGLDWAFVAGTLLAGKHEEIPEVLMVRDETPSRAYVRQVRTDNPRAFDRLFPMAPMTRDLLLRQRIPLDLDVIRALVKINLEHHCIYAAEYHPRYSRLVGRHIANQLWRISPARRLERREA